MITYRLGRKENGTKTSLCSRRVAGRVRTVLFPQPCTAPRTCSVQDGTGIPPPVVVAKKYLHVPPRGVNGIRVRVGDRIFEVEDVVDGAMLVT